MKTVYCISGLGADEKAFQHLNIQNYRLKHIAWRRPRKRESIEHYAARMAEDIAEESPVLIGLSFGGMISIEIAKLRPVQKIILISSIKTVKEMPRWMKAAGNLKLNKILPTRHYNFTERYDNYKLGVSNEQERKLVNDYRKAADKVYLEWSIDRILNWKNNWTPPIIFHIHGDEDKIFPVKRVTPTHIVKGGTHIMVINKAREISKMINGILND